MSSPSPTRWLIAALCLAFIKVGDEYLSRLAIGDSDAGTVDISRLPLSFPGWEGEERPMTAQEKKAALVNRLEIISRAYKNPGKDEIIVMLSYSRGRGLHHTPDLCLTANGWTIDHRAGGEVAYGRDRRQAPVNTITATREGYQATELYLFATKDRVNASFMDVMRQNKWRRGGGIAALVTIVHTYKPDGQSEHEAQSLELVKRFAADFLPYVQASMGAELPRG